MRRPCAVVFSGASGLGHVICTGIGSDVSASVRESWLLRSTGTFRTRNSTRPKERESTIPSIKRSCSTSSRASKVLVLCAC